VNRRPSTRAASGFHRARVTGASAGNLAAASAGLISTTDPDTDRAASCS